MARYRYRGVTAAGTAASGELEAGSPAAAVARVRLLGVTPIEVGEAPATPAASGPAGRVDSKTRKAVTKTIAELAVLLGAGLSLDRALALALDNIEAPRAKAEFEHLLARIREGVPLARAMAERPAAFPPVAQAMVEAGEANGRLGEALARVASTAERNEELRALIGSSMIYPIALLVIATGVILLMLLGVVPQFESLFEQARGKLPPASAAVMGASQFLRANGWLMLGGLVALVLVARQLLRRPSVRASFDRLILGVPQLGSLVTYAETAQFARTLSVLVEGGVALPVALGMAQRSLGNSHISAAVARVASGLKEGGGLTAPLAAARVFPKLALGFFRTGEESSQLGPMLGRLADVLDREVRLRLQRLIGILTPIITVVLGAAVAGIIAAIMTAILGFNDLAVA